MPTWADPNSVQNATAGAVIQSALLDQIRDDLMVLRQPKFAYVSNAFENISNTTDHTCVFATEFYDTASMFTPGNSYVAIPETGIYDAIATAEWDAVVGGRRFLEFRIGGSSLGHVTGPAAPGGDCAQSLVLPHRGFTSGDHVEAHVYQDSGVTVQVLVTMSLTMIGTL